MERTNGSPVAVAEWAAGVIGQRCDLVNPVEGDAMEFTPVDRLAAEMHYARARESLRALAALLQPQGPAASSGVVRAAIATAGGALDGAAAALDPDAVDAARVACPFCRSRVMRAASLCGACWRKLPPSRGS
jgi:hypothetical protein